ncbi:MAG: histone deacetylase [Candidatus Altiarchaeales archaeon ex4484_2]|nr:MAG: histone deacetylase [Candidatus Altiarchaeales archaeon ex4484_2]
MSNTALVYSKRYMMHDAGKSHPESPGRLTETVRYLQGTGLMDRLRVVEPKTASIDDLARVHSIEHIERIRDCSETGGCRINADTYISEHTFETALLAAGGVLTAGDLVVNKSFDNAFAMVRPPGHHARYDKAAGFCYFNNVAIAVRFLQHKYNLERIMIFDWDTHAADGTMSIFWNDPSVLNISIHQDPNTLYPGTGFMEQVGEGEGEGYTVNIPVAAGSQDQDYRYIIENFVKPLARSYKPQVIIISAGMDSHKKDLISQIALTEKGYSEMTRAFMELADGLCDGRIFLELEGGYNLKALGKSSFEILKSLLGEPGGYVIDGALVPHNKELVDALREKFSSYHNL